MALFERPQLNLLVPVAALPELDRPGPVERHYQAALREAIAADSGDAEADLASLELDARIDLLRNLYRARTGAKPLLPEPEANPDSKQLALEAEVQALEALQRGLFSVTDQDLVDLARARAQAIQ